MNDLDHFHGYPQHWTAKEHQALISLLIAVARADGMQPQEEQLLKTAATALQWKSDELQNVLQSNSKEIPEHMLKDSAYILRDLYLLAMADDKITDIERQKINQIADLLHLTEPQKSCIEKAVLHRLMSDDYWMSALNNQCQVTIE
jgi:uncharacterized tellurite resistance protein B-like protein